MLRTRFQVICWSPIWSPGFEGVGLERVALETGCAESTLLAVAEGGIPFCLTYRLIWDEQFRIRDADLEARIGEDKRGLHLRADGQGRWQHADGDALPHLDGCIDIDIWPTPLTNSLPLWRSKLQRGERRTYRMAWISAPELTVQAKPQAYTHLSDSRYLFESLDGDDFQAELAVDQELVVLDYPGLFQRVKAPR